MCGAFAPGDALCPAANIVSVVADANAANIADEVFIVMTSAS